MSDFDRTMQLLTRATGVSRQDISASSITYFLTKEHRTPEEIVKIALNQRDTPRSCIHGRSVCGICAEARQ